MTREELSARIGPSWLIVAGIALVFAAAAVVTPADADLWGHLTFGRDIVRSGNPVQTDVYSFTSDRPWINHEWLAEVIFFKVYEWGGSAGLILFKLSTIATLLLLVSRYLGRIGASARSIGVGLALVFIGTYWRLHNVRPQLFSVLLFAVILIAMRRADAGQWRSLFLTPLLMAVWVNLHGGWIVGMGVLELWVGLRIADWRRPTRERLVLAAVGIATMSAMLANPHGVDLPTFLAETVRLERADIEDWNPTLTSPLALGGPWLLTLAAGALALWRSGWPPRLEYVTIVALLAIASFQVSRLDAFFTLAVIVLLAPELVRSWSWARHATTGLPRLRPGRGFGVIAITVAALVGMLVPTARLMRPYATCLTVGGAWAPEAEAGRFITANQLRGRMLTWYDWGEYVIWHAGPDLQVSMDGRRETVYTDRTIQSHRRFYAADETGLSLVRAYNPDYIWLPKNLPVVERLTKDGWMPVFTGPASLVFAQPGAGPFQHVAESTSTWRCFPGP